ncbi:hypothetical protein GY45DRAFT_1318910 [Cubamyces sp. BRFM 1775]|nr:hypothetical protein GY45DRAFT_1318910 [Cubamyces sp. BRFM 1775]
MRPGVSSNFRLFLHLIAARVRLCCCIVACPGHNIQLHAPNVRLARRGSESTSSPTRLKEIPGNERLRTPVRDGISGVLVVLRDGPWRRAS